MPPSSTSELYYSSALPIGIFVAAGFAVLSVASTMGSNMCERYSYHTLAVWFR